MKPIVLFLSVSLSYLPLKNLHDFNDPCTLINASFANSPLIGDGLTPDGIQKLWKDKVKLEKRFVKNIHDDYMDTLLCYSFSKSQFVFFKGNGNLFLRAATIGDNSITLSSGIKVGDKKTDVLKALHVDGKKMCDSITITDEDNFAHHHLFFESGQLLKVTLDFGTD